MTQERRSRPLLGFVWGIIARPRQTFVYLKENHKRGWWVPEIIILGLMLAPPAIEQTIAVPLMPPMSLAEPGAIDDLGALPNAGTMSEFPIDGKGAGEAAQPIPSAPSFGWLKLFGVAIGTPLTWLVWSGVLYLTSVFLGRSSHFAQMFRLTVWAWMPHAVRGLVQTVLLLVTRRPIVNAGLASLVTDQNGTAVAVVLASVLSRVDVYLLWSLALLTLGLVVFTNLPRKKALVATLSIWVMLALLGTIPVLIKGVLGPAGNMLGNGF